MIGTQATVSSHIRELVVLQMQTTSIAIREDKHWKSLEDMCWCKGMNYRYIDIFVYICIYLYIFV